MPNLMHVRAVMSLYKRVLTLHRNLPEDFRILGDQYVKDEFRRHKTANKQETKAFMKEWTSYASDLSTQFPSKKELGIEEVTLGSQEPAVPDLVDNLREDQLGQLYTLKLSIYQPEYVQHLQESNDDPDKTDGDTKSGGSGS